MRALTRSPTIDLLLAIPSSVSVRIILIVLACRIVLALLGGTVAGGPSAPPPFARSLLLLASSIPFRPSATTKNKEVDVCQRRKVLDQPPMELVKEGEGSSAPGLRQLFELVVIVSRRAGGSAGGDVRKRDVASDSVTLGAEGKERSAEGNEKKRSASGRQGREGKAS